MIDIRISEALFDGIVGERNRLRVINADLLAALKAIVYGDPNGVFEALSVARAAIRAAETRGE
jgi:hypothetical protein